MVSRVECLSGRSERPERFVRLRHFLKSKLFSIGTYFDVA